MHSFLGVPVMTRGVAFGNLYLAEKQPAGSFTEEDEENVTLLAAQAAVAIENAGSVQRDALRRAVEAQEVERRRLARELHDETGQALTSILLGLAGGRGGETTDEAHAAAAELRTLVVETLQDVRRLAVEFRPSALDDFGLEPALDASARAYARRVPRRPGRDDARRRATPARCRDGRLPDRAGGAHERCQACRRARASASS